MLASALLSAEAVAGAHLSCGPDDPDATFKAVRAARVANTFLISHDLLERAVKAKSDDIGLPFETMTINT